jgi:hypothetical protein
VIRGCVRRYARADWSLLFDGACVLREETPLSIDRSPTPRFLPVDGVRPGG